MEGIYTQYPTGSSCDICDGIAVVDVNDGEHYLRAAHAMEPMMEINLTGDEPVVTLADAPATASNVVLIGARSTTPDVVIADAGVQELLNGRRSRPACHPTSPRMNTGLIDNPGAALVRSRATDPNVARTTPIAWNPSTSRVPSDFDVSGES